MIPQPDETVPVRRSLEAVSKCDTGASPVRFLRHFLERSMGEAPMPRVFETYAGWEISGSLNPSTPVSSRPANRRSKRDLPDATTLKSYQP